MSSNGSVAGLTSRPAKIADYIAIMRLDHATKHVFVVPGAILALLLRGSQVHLAVWSFVAGARQSSLNGWKSNRSNISKSAGMQG